jgi:hypothetical protein
MVGYSGTFQSSGLVDLPYKVVPDKVKYLTYG